MNDTYPLTVPQLDLWLATRIDGIAFNTPLIYGVRGAFNVDAWALALRAVIARHDALRTTIEEDGGGEVVQVVHSTADMTFEVYDARDWKPERVRELIHARSTAPFDLGVAPLLRACAIRTTDDHSYLLHVISHLIVDGTSWLVMLDELVAAYVHGEVKGAVPSVRFRDYVALSQQMITGRAGEKSGAYWQGELAGTSLYLDLPLDRPRPSRRSGGCDRVFVELTPPLQTSLAGFAREHRSTPPRVLLAAFAATLRRYSTTADFVIGCPVLGRPKLFDRVLGTFDNVALIRAQIDIGTTFLEVVQACTRRVAGALEHQLVPLSTVAQRLELRRGKGVAPYDVLFNVNRARGRGAATLATTAPTPYGPMHTGQCGRLGDAQIEDCTLTPAYASCDLAFQGRAYEDGVRIELEYDVSVFERATIEQFAAHFTALLSASLDAPGQPVLRLPIQSATEHGARVVEDVDPRSVPARIAAHVARTPNAIALEVIHPASQLTYRELDESAARLAHVLVERGVGHGGRVAVVMSPSSDLVVALLAVWKAGAAYVVLDPDAPLERLLTSSRAAAVQAIVTLEAYAARASELSPPGAVVVVDRERDVIAKAARSAPANNVDGLACVMLSGRTPTVDGITHVQLARSIGAVAHGLATTTRDTVLAITRPDLDLANLELWLPLCCGAKLVLATEAIGDPETFGRLLAAISPTLVQAPPGLWSELVDTGWNGQPELTALCVGNAVPPGLLAALAKRTRRSFRLGGSSSTLWLKLDGLPLTRLAIVDEGELPVPHGVPGRLCDASGSELVAFGELARWRVDGTLERLGRADEPSSLRGFRVDRAAIERVLMEHPAIRQAAVVIRDDGAGPVLIGYLVARTQLDLESVRVHLAARLAGYLIPEGLVVVERLPLSLGGMVDHRALPAPNGDVFAADEPRSADEQELAAIIGKLLGIARVGRQANFFALGGSSLMATRLVSQLRAKFGVELPLRAVFDATTVEALAARVATLRAGSEVPAHPPLVPVPRDSELEASFGQQRFWMLAQLDERDAYDMSYVVRIGGALDQGALVRAMDALVARHEVLRTTLAEVDGRVVQRITPPRAGVLAAVDVETYEAAHAYCHAAVQRPFELTATLFEPVIVRISADDHLLLLRMHHIVADAWSMDVLWRELDALYRGHELATLTVQYADFAVWQRSWLVGDVLDRQLAYWQARLKGAEPLELPTDRKRPAVLGTRGAMATRVLPVTLGPAMEALGRAHHTTPFMTWLAAFYVLLHRYTHQADLSVGTPVAHRRDETDGLIGYFVNTVVLRADLSNNPRFADVLTHVREVALGAYEHEDVPFERVVEAQRLPRDLARTPLFQVMFVFRHPEAPALAGLSVRPVELEHEVSSFDLTLFVEQRPEGMMCAVEYHADLFDRATIDRMLVHYEQLVEDIVADATRPIGALRVLDAHERHQILVAWNATARDFPEDACLHELVEAQVDRRPEAIAIELDGVQLTYRELDERANQLAHCLIAQGAGPEVKVAVFVLRSIEMVIAILGIMKAGAAYVPLETKAPPDRLEFILADASATLVVTQSSLVPQLGGSSARLVTLDGDRSLLARAPTTRPRSGVRTENVAYVIYTSGSTGRPKGVQVEHRQIVNLVTGSCVVEGIEPADRLLQFSSIAFGSSVEELFTPLLSGATMVLRGEDVPTALELFGPRFAGVTVMNMATAYWHSLVAALRGQEVQPPSTLRMINIGGERALPEYLRLWDQLVPGCALNNQYGPSETTVMATAWRLDRAELLEGREAPIGRPLPNYKVYVLDARGEPVPVGVDGELYIAGESVARGYLDRPELTAEKFLRNPFGPGRMYRTGDLVRWRADGNLEFVRRVDDQVKIRGFRVELGEIEAVFTKHPAVRNVAVLARSTGGPEKQLVAYVVLRAAMAPEELGAYLRSRLPTYMVPARFVVVDELPITATGKVNKAALPDVPGEALVASRTYEAPQGALEVVLAGIWCELLKLDEVSRHDNFFELGGHSLLAMKLIERLRHEGIGVTTVRVLFAIPTLSEFALALQPGSSTGRVDDLEQVSELEREAASFTIPPVGSSRPAATGTVLVTGGTGFVGPFLIDALLRSTSDRIICLVRAASDEDATRRIRVALEKFRLPLDGFDRVIGVAADLGLPRLGVGDDRFARLASVDTIYHSGAVVNFISPYRALEATNVRGTLEIIELAAICSTPLHYISTIAFLAADGKQKFVADEQYRPEHVTGAVVGGYSQTKWVAERLMARAADAGHPVTIHRLGAMPGHSQWPYEDDFWWRSLQTYAQLGFCPRSPYSFNLTPIDYVANAIVSLAQDRGTTRDLYSTHIVNPAPFPAEQLAPWFRSNGIAMTELPYAEWERRFLALAGSQETPLHPFLSLFAEGDAAKEVESTKHGYEVLCTKTYEQVSARGIRCPTTAELLDVYARWLSPQPESGEITR